MCSYKSDIYTTGLAANNVGEFVNQDDDSHSEDGTSKNKYSKTYFVLKCN